MKSTATIFPTFAYVGCITSKERDGHGKGISVYRVDQSSGAWTLVQVLDTLPNPGFLSLDRQQKFLYSAHGDGAEISAYAIDKSTGELQLLNRQPTYGDNSPHLVVDPTNRYVIVSNGPGLAVFPINKDGSLAPSSDIVISQGKPGPYRKEQHRSHPHQGLFDPLGRFLVVPDKGLDQVHVYKLDVSTGRLVPNAALSVKTRYGAGPRHIAFHPSSQYAYVINELNSTVTSYHWDAERGELHPFQVITTLPTNYTGDNTGSEIIICPSGKFVYATNRGHDSIAIFSVDPDSGGLQLISWEATRGQRPRFSTLDLSGRRLYAANQNSDSIIVFEINLETGGITPTGQVVQTGSPYCIEFAYS